jgi:hypothetical protein
MLVQGSSRDFLLRSPSAELPLCIRKVSFWHVPEVSQISAKARQADIHLIRPTLHFDPVQTFGLSLAVHLIIMLRSIVYDVLATRCTSSTERRVNVRWPKSL